jgi:glutamate/tyrosine decarboxylase-like PLP-dependent enzyme
MFVDRGPQNSRGFRALKVWLGLLASGSEGVRKSIAEDIGLSRYMADVLSKNPNIEVLSQSLSITTFRYVPSSSNEVVTEERLSRLNKELLHRLQRNGQAFVSQTTIGEKFALRACIVNFRTIADDIHVLERHVDTLGAQIHMALLSG